MLRIPQAMALSPSPSSSTQRRTSVCPQRGSDTVVLQDRQKSKASLTASWEGSGVVEEDGQAISQQCDSFPESFMRPVNAAWFCRHYLWEAEAGWRQISTKPLEQLKCGLGTFSPIPFPWGTQKVRSSGQIPQPFLLTVALSDRALRYQQAELTCSTRTVCPLQKRAQWCMWSCWITFQLGPTSRRQRVFMRCAASVERQVSQPSVHCAGLSLKHGCQHWAFGLRMLPLLLLTYVMVLKKIIQGLGTAKYKHTAFKRQCFDTAQLQLYIPDICKNNWVFKK